MQEKDMTGDGQQVRTRDWLLNRREFLAGVAALGVAEWAEPRVAWGAEAPGWSGLPARPEERPLDFHALANAFDAWVMDPAHGLYTTAKDGRQVFPSALEGEQDGGLTTYAPMALGKELRGEGLAGLATSLKGYFSEPYGLFLDGAGATLCEYWYLVNVTAMAYGLIRLRFRQDAEWLARVEKSAMRLKEMAKQIHYDFNSQGYDFAKGAAFTNHDIYRQPDAVGGYSYVMLLAWKLTGKETFLAEAKVAMDRYLDFAANPWYEVPSGAMAVLAAARLEAMGYPSNARKALGFVLDAKVGLMASGRWGGHEVNGLMAGFCTEPAGQTYSMESMVTLPYLLPAVRFRPELAVEVARLALNVAANMRLFYPEYLPRENQSRPDLPAMFPYERLSREEKDHSPYATGDFAGHRSIYGGAYAMWLDKMIEPQGDPWLLRWDLGKTDFMEPDLPPAYLYYNPWPEEKRVTVTTLNKTSKVFDLRSKKELRKQAASVELILRPFEAQVIEIRT
ncbi:MAG: hypothetical protein ABR976_20420 [Terracidiphilus sp.]|jgi:hypothetical protein